MAETPAAISAGVFRGTLFVPIIRTTTFGETCWNSPWRRRHRTFSVRSPALAEIHDAARREEAIPDLWRSPATADVLAAWIATPEVHDGITQHDDFGLTRLHQRDRGRVARRPIIDAPVPSLHHAHECRRDARARRPRRPFDLCPDRPMVKGERARFDPVAGGQPRGTAGEPVGAP
jgi:hypothetical protein